MKRITYHLLQLQSCFCCSGSSSCCSFWCFFPVQELKIIQDVNDGGNMSLHSNVLATSAPCCCSFCCCNSFCCWSSYCCSSRMLLLLLFLLLTLLLYRSKYPSNPRNWDRMLMMAEMSPSTPMSWLPPRAILNSIVCYLCKHCWHWIPFHWPCHFFPIRWPNPCVYPSMARAPCAPPRLSGLCTLDAVATIQPLSLLMRGIIRWWR